VLTLLVLLSGSGMGWAHAQTDPDSVRPAPAEEQPADTTTAISAAPERYAPPPEVSRVPIAPPSAPIFLGGRQVFRVRAGRDGLDPVQRAVLTNLLAVVQLGCGLPAEAERLLRSAQTALETLHTQGSPQLAVVRSNLGSALEAQGREDEALEAYDASISTFEELGLADHPDAVLARRRADALVAASGAH